MRSAREGLCAMQGSFVNVKTKWTSMIIGGINCLDISNAIKSISHHYSISIFFFVSVLDSISFLNHSSRFITLFLRIWSIFEVVVVFVIVKLSYISYSSCFCWWSVSNSARNYGWILSAALFDSVNPYNLHRKHVWRKDVFIKRPCKNLKFPRLLLSNFLCYPPLFCFVLVFFFCPLTSKIILVLWFH